MDWSDVLGFIIKLLTQLAALAWPAVAVYFLYTQRGAISTLIAGLRLESLEGAGVKAKFVDDKLETAAESLEDYKKDVTQATPEPDIAVPDSMGAEIIRVSPPNPAEVRPPTTPAEHALANTMWRFDQVEAFLGSSPSILIERAWQSVRRALLEALNIEREADDWFDADGLSDHRLYLRAIKTNKLDGRILKAVEELMLVHGDATTDKRWQPSKQQALEYARNAEEVVQLVRHAGKR